MNLYITADQINRPSHGGGSVTFNESEALKSLGPCEVWGRKHVVHSSGGEPWNCDDFLTYTGNRYSYTQDHALVHFYAGTFSRTIEGLKKRGSKITYTAAAHSVEESRKAHEELGIPYNYPHLTDPELWKRYLQGYKDADVLIVPSTHSEKVMRSFGCENRIVVIPHGVYLPRCDKCKGIGFRAAEIDGTVICSYCSTTGVEPIKSIPSQFTVGYLGNCGAPDKGLRYLFAAWKKLNYPDAILKVAGHDSTSAWVARLWQAFGGGNVQFCGWQEDAGVFYDSLNLYVQPSVTEGFGLEVLEAMSYGRPVICSEGAGAADRVGRDFRVPACDADALAAKIDRFRNDELLRSEQNGRMLRKIVANNYTWDSIKQRYVEVWKGLLA